MRGGVFAFEDVELIWACKTRIISDAPNLGRGRTVKEILSSAEETAVCSDQLR